jgi:hypothetical protein
MPARSFSEKYDIIITIFYVFKNYPDFIVYKSLSGLIITLENYI